jgi:hypothetical protein
MYGSPFGLIILSIMRVIFSFTLVELTKQCHKYVYFVSWVLLVATFPTFVLPANVYKTEVNNFLERFIRKLRARWI